MKCESKPRSRGGFTLIEAAVATAIVGIGVVALLTAAASSTRTNDAGKKMTQAVFLAQEIREWTLKLPFSDPDPGDQANPPGPDGADPQVFVDDLDDLMGVTYAPPRDGQGYVINDLPDWSETITLTWVQENDLTTAASPGTTNVIFVSVAISYKESEVLTTGWLISRKD